MAVTLPPAEHQYQLQHINDDRQPMIYGVFSMLTALATISLFLRLYSRRVYNAKLGRDDWAIIAGYILHLGDKTSSIISVVCGLGRHYLYSITYPSRLSTRSCNISNYSVHIVYALAWPTIKISILFFYQRLFETRKMRIGCWFFILVLVVYGLICAFFDVFACLPIRSNWETVPGTPKCINDYKLAIISAGFNVAFDSIILVMPLPYIWRLRNSLMEKVGLTCLFSIGIIATIASLMRIVTTFGLDPYDGPWEYVPSNIWASSELSLSVVCACLPCVLPALRHIKNNFKRLIGYKIGTSIATPDSWSNENVDESAKDSKYNTQLTPNDKNVKFKSKISGGGFSKSKEFGDSVDDSQIGVERDILWEESGRK